MKLFFLFILLVAVGSVIFIFGNSLRCMSAKNGTCPAMCKKITIDCSARLDERCLEGAGTACQGLTVDEYVNMAKNAFVKK